MVARSDRFDSKVDRSGPHHLWLGARSAQGVGQVRVDGKLMTAPRAAWARAYGDPPSGSKVLACPDEPACVRPEHLRLDRSAPEITTRRARRGSGSIAERSDGSWRITASAGSDDSGNRRRAVRTIRGTKQDATKALAELVAETGDGSQLPSRTERDTTVDALVAWYLDFARTERGLEHSTLVGYADAYKTWIKPADRFEAGQLDPASGPRQGVRSAPARRTLAQSHEQRPCAAQWRVQVGQATPEGGIEPRRRFRTADNDAPTTNSEDTRAGRPPSPARRRRSSRSRACTGPQARRDDRYEARRARWPASRPIAPGRRENSSSTTL